MTSGTMIFAVIRYIADSTERRERQSRTRQCEGTCTSTVINNILDYPESILYGSFIVQTSIVTLTVR